MISLIFSFALYRVSSQEIDRGLSIKKIPTSQIIDPRRAEVIYELRETQQKLADEARIRLKANLLGLNLFILVSGGLVSYLLARKTLKPIEEAHEAQSRFTADASHELRTPITAMRIETELTLTEPDLDLKQAKDQLQSNIEELDKLNNLSESLLKLSNFENNGLVKEAVSVDHLINQAIERVTKKAQQKNQDIAAKNIVKSQLHVNQQSIVEAIVTLLDNAIKYSPNKSEIKVTTKKQKNNIQINIVDKGLGIDQNEQQYIFDRFYRADSSRCKTEDDCGYGIGLSIARTVAEAHKGTVSVKSTPGKGSTFTLQLPLS